MTDQMPQQTLSVAQLPAVFFGALDQHRYDDVAALMARDGIWHRQGKALAGGESVLQAMQERPRDFATAHIITNVIVEAAAAGASVSFLSTVYTHKGEHEGPFPLVAPAQIGRYVAECTWESESWKISKLSNVVLFKAEDAR